MKPNPDLPFRLIQITDCHISADSSVLYRDRDPVSGLTRIVQTAAEWKPDLVLATGDMSEDGSDDSYRTIFGILDHMGSPVLGLPGNHDDCTVMQNHCPDGPWVGAHAASKGNWTIILLNSTEPEEIEGSFGEQTLESLRDILEQTVSSHVLLALHHQPVPVGAPWIDRYALRSPEQFWNVVDQAPQVRCVVWGHIHQDFRSRRKGMMLLGAPSTVANSLPGTQRLELDPGGPACRWIELYADGAVKEGILYAKASTIK
jgi:Icc protein